MHILILRLSDSGERFPASRVAWESPMRDVATLGSF